MEGNLIKWQKWNIRHSFNYREGLVLHDVGCAGIGGLAVYWSARPTFLMITIALHVSQERTECRRACCGFWL